MKHEKISIKWKIFLYLLIFTGILLTVLWLLQICYLDSFYKRIKSNEAESLIGQITDVLESDAGDAEEQIDNLAASRNMTVLVTDMDWNTLYSAEYIVNSRLSTMPPEQVEWFYDQAVANGGRTKVEFEGGMYKDKFSDGKEQPIIPQPEGEQLQDTEVQSDSSDINNEPTINETGDVNPGADGNIDDDELLQPLPEVSKDGFMQNFGQDRVESVIYVDIIEVDGEELLLLVNTQLTPVDATVHTLRAELSWITVIMILLSLGIALLISKQVSKSLIRINESAKEMARGNFEVRFEGKDYREVAELSDTLNQTAVELDKNEHLRRELIANVSHDLRTPLTMIIAYAEVMRDLPGENTPENVQVVIDEAERLTNLVNDMLDISKLQAGVLEKKVSVYNLTESIESVFERYNKLKEQDGYTITFLYDRKVTVEADEYKLFQVIYNLVNNAINYAGEDKTVTIIQTVHDGKVRIEVKDNGAGIAADALPYVWDRYYKVDKEHKRAVMGTGLGLSIVKSILELHEAEYGVESVEGHGSTFWFKLPIIE